MTLPEILLDPQAYPHPARDLRMIETHISWVFLAGEHAYKVKKPLRLPFLDYSTRELREAACREELRLNRRTAPELYIDVVPIGGLRPSVDGGEPVLDWAVRMHRFPQQALFAAMADDGLLQPWQVDSLAEAIASFHGKAEVCAAGSDFGAPSTVEGDALSNFSEIAALSPPEGIAREALAVLRQWTADAAATLRERFDARRAGGFVRECHGDLHLNNVVLMASGPRPFDCIEFDPALRRTDVMSDVAFLFMDFAARGLPRLGYRFLDRYLERTGDFEGVRLLRFYAVYRAMVRAKVAYLRWAQATPEKVEETLDDATFHVELAARLAQVEAPVMVLMHGPSASGKTGASQRVLESLGAIRVRSDIERWRLPAAAAKPGERMYAKSRIDATYARLAVLAAAILDAGYPVVVDATFLSAARRARFHGLAATKGAALEIMSCRAPADVLRARIELRLRKGHDASEADLSVLAEQLRGADALDGAEGRQATLLDTTSPGEWIGAVETFARRHGNALRP